ncbi:hypothetical protein CCAX7_30020 [Capsulimonas corticalis]|uniref:Uncharacterized protein n=1 Tax=Capsulimonas corticalis TaxID=2219043 RepID=A0A402CSU7_9BACT|nr:hypothetical protein [Capsulimonas corticalis]BDI30951.1 hypothetical protein CCAX7_30020 [Capsulimonas corticalis]
MVDPWNPTHSELKDWAYTIDAEYPDGAEQDWELAVVDDANIDLVIEWAGDKNCPNRDFFLLCLYLYVGDAVRSNWPAFSQDIVVRLIKQNTEARNPRIREWAKQSLELIAHPRSFRYDLWCDGELAMKNCKAHPD